MKSSEKQNYNDIPVYFCRKCLSLLIKHDSMYGDYCPECGSFSIQQAHIEDYLKLKEKFNK